jgi:N-acetylmuramoyl-L-alanine amidase
MNKINKLIIHCSATPENRKVSVQTIREWHLARGWSDIGYHYVIGLDGTIANGRDLRIQGAHTRGENKNSLGICYIGGVELDGKTPKDTRTDAQKESLTELLLELKSLFCDSVVHGHRDFSNKACPSFDATTEYKWISNGYCKCTQEEV